MTLPGLHKRERLEHDLIERYELLDVEVHPDFVTNTTYHGDHGDQLFTEKWKRIGSKLGSGNFGTVWLEESNGPQRNNNLRAIKEVRVDEEEVYKFEIATLARFCRHRHLFANFYGWYIHDDFAYLALEYFPLGDLGRYISTGLSEADAKSITKQLLQGAHILHLNNVIHRDLKPKNVLVARTGPQWLVKIEDFGTVKRLQSEESVSATFVGTLAYGAPELHRFVGSDFPTKSVDLWSIGCITFEILSGQKPFGGDLMTLKRYCDGDEEFPSEKLYEKAVSKNGVTFVQSLLSSRPRDRLTAVAARDSTWLKESLLPTPPLKQGDPKNAQLDNGVNHIESLPASGKDTTSAVNAASAMNDATITKSSKAEWSTLSGAAKEFRPNNDDITESEVLRAFKLFSADQKTQVQENERIRARAERGVIINGPQKLWFKF